MREANLVLGVQAGSGFDKTWKAASQKVRRLSWWFPKLCIRMIGNAC